MAENPDYDVLIAGSGIVGLTLACLLGREGPRLRVAVVEARPAQPPGPEAFELRVSAIGRAAQAVLAAAAAWQRLPPQRLFPFREMRVWDACGGGTIHFDSAEIGEDRLGYIVENRAIEEALLGQLQALDGMLLRPAEVKALAPAGQSVGATLADGRRLSACLVVGADGSESCIRRLAGLGTLRWSYEQQAVVATVETSQPNRETAWQAFLASGPLAFLPLSEHHSSIVWSTTPEQAQHLLALDADGFLAELQTAFGTRLGRMLSVGERAAYPLRALHATDYVRPRVALVGDAAHTIHPLAGQGVNLGLLDAAALAEVLLDGTARGRDPGGFTLLRRYERWRKGDNAVMLAVMEGFHRLFRTELGPLPWLRSQGLRLTDALVPVKSVLMRQAMGMTGGITGELPRLARPAPL